MSGVEVKGDDKDFGQIKVKVGAEQMCRYGRTQEFDFRYLKFKISIRY